MNKRQKKKLAKKLGHKKARIYNNRVWVAGRQKKPGLVYYSRINDPNFVPELNYIELSKAYLDMAVFGTGIIEVFEDGTIKNIGIDYEPK